MLYLTCKAVLSGVIIATVSEVARRSQPLVLSLYRCPWYPSWAFSGCGMIPATSSASPHTPNRPPMFLVVPPMLHYGSGFWVALAVCCALTFVLYLGTIWLLAKFGVTF
jgi:hypothetical protein